jgi:hypothetical protein
MIHTNDERITQMSEQKTKSLGLISVDRFAKQPAWREYDKAAAAFSKAKQALNSAKSRVKEMLKKHSSSLAAIENLDFNVQPSRREIAVFEKLTVAGVPRTKGKEIEFDAKA